MVRISDPVSVRACHCERFSNKKLPAAPLRPECGRPSAAAAGYGGGVCASARAFANVSGMGPAGRGAAPSVGAGSTRPWLDACIASGQSGERPRPPSMPPPTSEYVNSVKRQPPSMPPPTPAYVSAAQEQASNMERPAWEEHDPDEPEWLARGRREIAEIKEQTEDARLEMQIAQRQAQVTAT